LWAVCNTNLKVEEQRLINQSLVTQDEIQTPLAAERARLGLIECHRRIVVRDRVPQFDGDDDATYLANAHATNGLLNRWDDVCISCTHTETVKVLLVAGELRRGPEVMMARDINDSVVGELPLAR